nr:unnamed protein product [Callosobruchus analis]
MERNHADELQVQEFMALEKHSLERKKLIDKLRREGEFVSSERVPVMQKNVAPENLIVCVFCRGYYSTKSLRRHAKKCYFNPDPSKRFFAKKEGQTLMCGHFGPNDPLKVSRLLDMLRPDEISMIAKKDKIICEVGRRYVKRHKQSHLLIVARRYMRRLARLLQCSRNLENKQNLELIDILCAPKFKTIVEATKRIAGYEQSNKTYKSPSLAFQMGTLINCAIDARRSLEIQKKNPNLKRLEQLNQVKILIESDWAFEISSEAGQNILINRFNKPTVIPAAMDIKKFDTYLRDLIAKSETLLKNNNKDLKAYRTLSEATFCSLLSFNRRRVGELQRLTVDSFTMNQNSMPSSEFDKILTNTEKILSKSLRRVVIRGKRGRGVPVLFTESNVHRVELLLSVRSNFSLDKNVFLFGIPGTENPISGYIVMRKYAKLALGDHNKASLLTSTKLRKHLATITQIFNMEKTELEQLATFMGHTERTHAEFYRLPDDVYQTGKISKLLVLSQKEDLEKYKGQSLKEIDLGDDLVEDNAEENIDDDETTSNESTDLSSVDHRSRSKRTLVQWTSEQKRITSHFFQDHIKKKIPPKKHDVERMTQKYANVFNNKTWPQIKVYVCNQYRSK